MLTKDKITTPPDAVLSVARFDVMLDGKWICQVSIPVCNAWEYEECYFHDAVLAQRPSLAGKKFNLQPTTNRIFKE